MSQPPFSILLVEDNPVNREMWSLYLTNGGFEVVAAENGTDALELLEEQTFDAVILDVMLPGLDGFEVLAKIRQTARPEELPVIMATSRDKSEDIVRGFELGANDYVTKPVHLEVLLKRIQSQLRTKSAPVLKADFVSQDPVPEGTVLDGRFEVEELIGRGSCGAVYRARHLGLGRAVAVKMLTAAAGVASEKRLRREGISACRIEHPNAVEVLDFCVSESVPFLVMQLLEGHSLDQEIREQGGLTPARCARILWPVCEVLAEAHSQGIIHRDVKPHNIFLHQARKGEVVKVLDFGIAKIIGERILSQRLTLEGSLVGTPAYMAPERLSDSTYDGRADVYSVGVMLYEMLCGERPFTSPDLLELIQRQVHEPPPPLRYHLPDLPAAAEAVVLAALDKDPRQRPAVSEMARNFATALGLDPDDFGHGPGHPPKAAAGGDRGGGSAPDRVAADEDFTEETQDWVATLPGAETESRSG